jgi:hypothetical protein
VVLQFDGYDLMREIEIAGEFHELGHSLQFLDEVAEKVDSRPRRLLNRIFADDWTIDDLRRILRASLRAGGSKLHPDRIIEERGLEQAYSLVIEVLTAAWAAPEEDSPEDDEPGEPTAPSGA